jgi:hypothetical protein
MVQPRLTYTEQRRSARYLHPVSFHGTRSKELRLGKEKHCVAVLHCLLDRG